MAGRRKLLSLVPFLCCACFISCMADTQLDGAHLTLAVYEQTPAVMYKRDGRGNIVAIWGLTRFVFDLLAEKMNFTYTLLPVKNWMEAMALVSTGRADGMGNYLVLRSEMYSTVDFSWYVLEDLNVFLLPAALEVSYAAMAVAQFTPFQPELWIVIVVAMGIVMLLTAALSWFVHRKIHLADGSFTRKLGESVVSLFAVLVGQGGGKLPSNVLVVRVLVGFWLLAVTVIAKYYQETIFSNLAVLSGYQPAVRTLDELANHPQLKVMTDKDSYAQQVFMSAPSGPYKKFGDELRQDPGLLITNRTVALERVASGCCTILLAKSLAYTLWDQDYKASGQCRFSTMPETFHRTLYGFGFPKNGPFNEKFNRQLFRMWDFGLFTQLEKPFRRMPSKCLARQNQQGDTVGTEFKPMDFSDLGGIFILLIGGYIVATFVFLMELGIKCFKKKSVAAL